MITITPQQRLVLRVEAVDFRKGIDSLIGLCRQWAQDPYDGTVFAFRNRRGTSIKLLVYDGTGFWLGTKRFSQGKLKYWPSSAQESVCATTMTIILNQGAPAKMSPSWRSLPGSP